MFRPLQINYAISVMGNTVRNILSRNENQNQINYVTTNGIVIVPSA